MPGDEFERRSGGQHACLPERRASQPGGKSAIGIKRDESSGRRTEVQAFVRGPRLHALHCKRGCRYDTRFGVPPRGDMGVAATTRRRSVAATGERVQLEPSGSGKGGRPQGRGHFGSRLRRRLPDRGNQFFEQTGKYQEREIRFPRPFGRLVGGATEALEQVRLRRRFKRDAEQLTFQLMQLGVRPIALRPSGGWQEPGGTIHDHGSFQTGTGEKPFEIADSCLYLHIHPYTALAAGGLDSGAGRKFLLWDEGREKRDETAGGRVKETPGAAGFRARRA